MTLSNLNYTAISQDPALRETLEESIRNTTLAKLNLTNSSYVTVTITQDPDTGAVIATVTITVPASETTSGGGAGGFDVNDATN